MSCSDIIVLVMAAGQSRRFGSDKRVAKLANGRPLLATTLKTIEKSFTHSRVVLKPDESALSVGLPPSTPSMISHRSALGLGYSISDAFAQLCRDESTTKYRAAAIWLADLPWVTQRSCKTLIDLAAPDNIVQPLCGEYPGHPVIFGRNFWSHLAELEEFGGASSIIRQHKNSVVTVLLNDPGIHTDIDYPNDLFKLPAT